MIEGFWLVIAGVSVLLAVHGVCVLEQIAAALERACPEPPPLPFHDWSRRVPIRIGLKCVLCESAFLPRGDGEGPGDFEDRAAALGWRVSPFTSPPQASTWMCPGCAAGRPKS